jgi:outer membrane protein assembly factor BamB
MKPFGGSKLVWAAPGAVALVALAALVVWLDAGSTHLLSLRVPGTDQPPGAGAGGGTNPIFAGKVIPGPGQAADLPGSWPQFRGPNREGISPEPVSLARAWDAPGPRELWSVELGEGYAGPAVQHGRVYVMDYDQQNRQDALRCLSLADGKEIWRFAYPVPVKRNHGMSRTVPTVTPRHVVAMGPKCHVVCVDAVSGELRWGLDLVRQFGAVVPPWYTGQCPLVDGTNVILAVGGTNTLLLAADLETGAIRWQTPNPNDWKMTHSSVVTMQFGGRRMHLYCASQGVVGVSAEDGALLWQTPDWKISIATVPSPVPLDDGRIFLSGGYDAGSLMLQLKPEGDRLTVQPLFRLGPEVFGATQQTPILHDRHLFGVRPDGQFVCVDLNGKVVWASGAGQQFGLGPFLLANGLFFALNDSGRLSLMEATPARFSLLAQAQVLKGRECWGPLALAGGRLLVRDLTRLACLDVAQR